MTADSVDAQHPTPSSILIIGGGVFGLSTAYALSVSPRYTSTSITLLDRSPTIPAPDAASCDNSRIIRSDYADAFYTSLAVSAQTIWRGEEEAASPSHPFHSIGHGGRYTQNGLLFSTNSKDEVYSDKALCNLPADQREAVKMLNSREEVVKLTNHAGGAVSGERGYFNPKAGWADAAESMKWVKEKVCNIGKVKIDHGEVKDVRSKEVELADGRVLKADVVVVAVGSWAEALMKKEIGGRVKRCPQPLGYVKLNDEMWEKVKGWPVHFNISDGTLMIAHPPTKSIKLAVHSLRGYNTIEDATKVLEFFARSLLPDFAAEFRASGQPLVTGVRLCCYADTRTGDFVVDWVPGLEGVMVAGGGSGHGFKFLPVLGQEIVKIMEGEKNKAKEKWKWPAEGTEVVGDGSRGEYVTE